MSVRVDVCRLCGSLFEQERRRGRPRELCASCAAQAPVRVAERKRAYYEANRQTIAEKQRAYREANRQTIAERKRAYYEANRQTIAERKRAYYEANRQTIAEKQRAYREANRQTIAERKRAYRDDRKNGYKTVTCTDCGERLARRTEDGLCGFCRQGIAA